MPIRSIKHRAADVNDVVVSGRVVDFRTARSASSAPKVDAKMKIWYHQRGTEQGGWFFYWRIKGTTTLNQIAGLDSNYGSVNTVDGSTHSFDHSSWYSREFDLNTYATDLTPEGRAVIIYYSKNGYRSDCAWGGHLLSCRNGTTIDLDPDVLKSAGALGEWEQYNEPTTWSSAGGSNSDYGAGETDVRANYATLNNNGYWVDVDYGGGEPINYGAGSTPSNQTGPDKNHLGVNNDYYLYVEGTGNPGEAAAAGYPFFTMYQMKYDYNLLTGSKVT